MGSRGWGTGLSPLGPRLLRILMLMCLIAPSALSTQLSHSVAQPRIPEAPETRSSVAYRYPKLAVPEPVTSSDIWPHGLRPESRPVLPFTSSAGQWRFSSLPGHSPWRSLGLRGGGSEVKMGDFRHSKVIVVDPANGDDDKGDGSDTSPMRSLFAALQHAVTEQEVEIVLRSGTYHGKKNRRLRLHMGAGQKLNLTGVGGCFVDGEGSSFLFNVSGEKHSVLNLKGISLSNTGCAIDLRYDATLRADSCQFESCYATAVKATGRSRVALRSCDFVRNHMNISDPKQGSTKPAVSIYERMGGAMTLRQKSKCFVAGCRFDHNGGDGCLVGGAIILETNHSTPIPAHLVFLGCTFLRNTVRDCGGVFGIFGQSCCNITDCLFENNSAWGVARGGSALYTQGLPTSWMYNCTFRRNVCPEEGGGVITKAGDVHDGYSAEDLSKLPLNNLDFRYCLFGQNSAYLMAAKTEEYTFGWLEKEAAYELGVKAEQLTMDLPTLPPDDTTFKNWTLPQEVKEAIWEDAQEKWLEQGIMHEEISEEQDWRQQKHWDAMEPDPDTGRSYAIPEEMREMKLSEFKNQSVLAKYSELCQRFGLMSGEVNKFVDDHVNYCLQVAYDRLYEPKAGWPEEKPRSKEEMAWCQEPLVELAEWSKQDVTEYYERAKEAKNRSTHWWQRFEAFARARDAEYEERELKAFDEFAKRMGWKGCMKPVRLKDWNSTEQVWASWLSEDFDPKRRPEWPWNQPMSAEEIAELYGPDTEMTSEDGDRLGRKRKAAATSDEGSSS